MRCVVLYRAVLSRAVLCYAVTSCTDSWWKLFNRFRFALNTLWVVPTGSLLRAYRCVLYLHCCRDSLCVRAVVYHASCLAEVCMSHLLCVWQLMASTSINMNDPR